MNINPWNLDKDGLAPVTGIMDWDVVIANGEVSGAVPQQMVILRCEERPHSWGEGPNCLYAAPRGTTVFDGNTLLECTEATPWFRSDWNVWGVQTFSHGYVKTKWDESSWRMRSGAYVMRNGERFLQVHHREVAMACSMALALIPYLNDHPLSLLEFQWEKKAINRPIWFHGSPAAIRRVDTCDRFNDQLFVMPDGMDEFPPPPGWQQPGEDICNPEAWRDDYAKGLWTELLCPGIDWFREVPAPADS